MGGVSAGDSPGGLKYRAPYGVNNNQDYCTSDCFVLLAGCGQTQLFWWHQTIKGCWHCIAFTLVVSLVVIGVYFVGKLARSCSKLSTTVTWFLCHSQVSARCVCNTSVSYWAVSHGKRCTTPPHVIEVHLVMEVHQVYLTGFPSAQVGSTMQCLYGKYRGFPHVQ